MTSERNSIWDPEDESPNPDDAEILERPGWFLQSSAKRFILTSSGTQFLNSTPAHFQDVYSINEADAKSAVETVHSIPAPPVKLEMFEDYAYAHSSPSVSGRNSLATVIPTNTAISVASTGASLSRRMQSGLDLTVQEKQDETHLSMFDQAFIHTRDLM